MKYTYYSRSTTSPLNPLPLPKGVTNNSFILTLSEGVPFYYADYVYVTEKGEIYDSGKDSGWEQSRITAQDDPTNILLIQNPRMKMGLVYIPYYGEYVRLVFDTKNKYGMKCYVQNSGSKLFYIETFSGIIKVEPYQIKEICKANVDTNLAPAPLLRPMRFHNKGKPLLSPKPAAHFPASTFEPFVALLADTTSLLVI